MNMNVIPNSYHMLTDEALCRQAAANDCMAEEALVMRYQRFVRACARPLFLAGGDSEDLLQEGMLGLLKAIREYDVQRGTTFQTYAAACIRNRLLSAVKMAARKKHTPLNHAISYEAPLFDGKSSDFPYGALHTQEADPEEVLIDREDQQERMAFLKNRLSHFETEILRLYLDGLSYSEIAAEVGKSTKSVDNAVQRIRRKMAQHINLA